MLQGKWTNGIIYFLVFLLILFILSPLIVILPISFSNSDMFQFPPDSFSLERYQTLFQDEQALSSIWLSLYIGLVSTVLATLLGLLAGLGVVRGRFPFRSLLESFFLGPLIVPLVTTGIGLLIFFAPLGMTGSSIGIILAHSVIISPYITRILIASLRQFNVSQEEAAIVHGATPWYAFRTIVIPQLLPAILSGAILAFLVSIDEYTVTVFLANADTITIPIRIYQFVSMDINPVVTALAGLIVICSFGLIALLEWKWKIHRYLEM
ncbi:putative spermidine/putrescine transport system permease protein [Seinonella peptonophila]|uniref:Putative spermidine/putrescine transport system permease protein n=1 Tax=Seinonella peptonophila TaxID=112248 RepID=A0A1M4SPH4_9BACL|nr:ABC transporter permease [Seinonella peptonophila]SHE34098.1 putative spermidine/putrescine transport system permease protein [Seinonella peptonophila]